MIMQQTKVVIECSEAAVAFDLDKHARLGAETVLDFGTGGHLHVVPYVGETADDVLARARAASTALGHSSVDVKISDDASLYAEGYDPQACLRC